MRPEKIKFENRIPVKAFVRRVEQYPYHWHEALEIVQVLKGAVNINLSSESLLLHENHVAVINMGSIHQIIEDEQDSKILIIQIDDHFYRSLLEDNRYLFIYCCSVYHGPGVSEKYEKLKEHITRLVWALSEKSHREYHENIKKVLTAMLTYITYNFDFLRWGPGTVEFDEKRVKRYRQIVEHMSNRHIGSTRLKDLAEKVNVSLYYLSHDIKEKFGFTFQELLHYMRIEHAAKLLLSTDKRIIDIVLECGFSDPKYLIKHFKKHFQCTPLEFRKMYQAYGPNLACQARYQGYPISHAIKYLK